MYTLFLHRHISGHDCQLNGGTFDILERAADELLHCGFWLNAHCVDDSGRIYSLVESDYFDEELQADCVSLSFALSSAMPAH